ncbi:very-long-chain 3-oxoacyl-CoA reductase-like [Penaeus japonicus]|uniref:very-long-chain 3-oxoacyl-CoA reductase-like n=1 Tax=Penaeus japonicus TaxID=27405 RepID=UPI001C714D3E|nr:very-long-chain 3-oxoacyl-CoA reductase-like [Penaeus japonicus]
MWELIGKAAVALVAARLGLSILKGIYGSFLAAALGLNLKVKKTGEWAVVTGATDGIGKAYAFELARQGMKVVLVSRTPFKLQNVAAEINSKYGTETKIIDVDFTKTDIYNRVRKELVSMHIGSSVGNVGMSYDHPEYFNNLENGDEFSVYRVLLTQNIHICDNDEPSIHPGMEERKRGLIINVASLSATIPAPLLAVYAATKAYVEMCPAWLCYVQLSKLKRPSLMIPTPTAYVRSTMKTTGIEKRTAGYFMHKLQIYFAECAKFLLPGSVLTASPSTS